MAGSEPSNPIAAAHAKAYRAYLQTLKESLADVDIEAASLPTVGTRPGLGCYLTYYTWYTIYTIYTIQTVATEASIE